MSADNMFADTMLYSLLERIFATVFPLVVIVLVGVIYARRHRGENRHHADMAVSNRINIDIFVPCLIFSVMASKDFSLGAYATLIIGAALVIMGSGLITLPLCKVLGVSRKTFVPPMMFNNSGNLGLPLALLAFGEQGLAAAIAMFLVSNLLHFSLGNYIINDQANTKSLLSNPIIIATVAGLIWNLTGFTLPEYIATALDMLGQIAIPLMLFSLGVRMSEVDFTYWKIGLYGAVLSPLSGIIVALPFAWAVDLSDQYTGYLVLFAVMPPAVLNFMLAERYQQQPQIVASVVLLGNIASLVFVPVTLFFIL